MRSLVIVCLVVAVAASSLLAGTDFKVSGQVRFRSEVDKRSFDTLAATTTPSYGRVRVGVEAVVDSNVRAYVQIQDSRVFGGVSPSGFQTSGTTDNAFNVDLHQGYLELPHLIGQHIGLKLGRFEVAWNNERLMGAVDWNNVGRSWEGGEAWYGSDNFGLSVVVLDARREFQIVAERSLFVVGVLASLKPYRIDLFLIDDWYLHQFNHAWTSESRSTAGVYTKQTWGALDFEATGAYQWGSVPWALPAAKAGYDISAYMFQGEIGYTLAGVSAFRVAGGIDFSSGDDRDDNDSKAFDNLYFTGHRFRGYMDYFNDPNSPNFAGLIDLYGRTRFMPMQGWTAGADFHYFQPAVDRIDAHAGSLAPIVDIGWEIDAVVRTTRVKGAVLDAGLSAFSATESYAHYAGIYSGQTDHDLGYWGYFRATVNF